MKCFNGIIIIFSILSLYQAKVEKARFDYYKVYKLKIDTLDQLQVLKELQNTSDSVIKKYTSILKNLKFLIEI